MHSSNKLSSLSKQLTNKKDLELCAMQCGIVGALVSNTSHSLAKPRQAKMVTM